MTTRSSLLIAATVFVVLATANSGGYRYGVSDQAFYQPALALAADPALFPRDREVLAPQMRAWVLDDLAGPVLRVTGADVPAVFLWLYLAAAIGFFAAAVDFARSLGASRWAVAAFLLLLTLKHRIAKTGVNSFEGYMHPRMIAFALGIAALASLVRMRFGLAFVWVAAAAVFHPSTAFWFGATVACAWLWAAAGPARAAVTTGAAVGVTTILAVAASAAGILVTMDPDWLAVLGDKDYLFSSAWPAYAWVTNLAYVGVTLAIYRARARAGVTRKGERDLVAALVVLVVVFLVSLPLAELRLALVVQMQINRVFWLLDFATAFYLAWWLVDSLGARWPAAGRVAVMVIACISIGRGTYILVESERPLFQARLAHNAWTDAMNWLSRQPPTWHVLADPRHALRTGTSLRVAAGRDTPLEISKDTAFAMYDREVAQRVAHRLNRLANFDTLSADAVRALDREFMLDAFVDRGDRSFDLPVMYRNDAFVIYDLR